MCKYLRLFDNVANGTGSGHNECDQRKDGNDHGHRSDPREKTTPGGRAVDDVEDRRDDEEDDE